MKNFVKILAVVVFISAGFTGSAQKPAKLGHINFNKLIEQMPGQDTVKTAINNFAKQLQNEYQAMTAELETKLTDYQKNSSTMSAIIKSTKEREINDLQQRMQDFQNSANQEMDDYQSKLTEPFITKAKQAIKDVAKENGYTYIFNDVEGLLLYTDNGDDIMPLVKKKMNIQ